VNPASPRLIFITGTGTGVGKTLLAGLLLHHLRRAGCRALAMKPFCSGGTGDVDLLDALQDRELPRDLLNPFRFPEAVAPLVAARKHHRRIHAPQTLRSIQRVAKTCDCLLIEGAGGLLAPLGEKLSAADLIASLQCDVVVVAPNRLGAINHTLLTSQAVQAAQTRRWKTIPTPPAVPVASPKPIPPLRLVVVLMGQARPDLSADSNGPLLSELLAPVPLVAVPFLGPRASNLAKLKHHARTFGPELERILAACAGRPSTR
jgi:dethiobiotin synthetase